MSEAPNPWDMVLSQIAKLDAKVDRIGERVVVRDEFNQYKAQAEKDHTALALTVEKQAATFATYKEKLDERERTESARDQDDRAKWRLFWAGVVLSPIAGAVVAWIVSGVLNR